MGLRRDILFGFASALFVCFIVFVAPSLIKQATFCTSEMQQRVQNTLKACEWCEHFNFSEENIKEFREKYGIIPAPCMGMGTCIACVEAYKAYYNLSDEEFPYYCWRSDENRPC